MSVGFAPPVLGTGADWQVWLLLSVALVLCWGLVIVATAALFGSRAGERGHRRARIEKSTHGGSPAAGRRDG